MPPVWPAPERRRPAPTAIAASPRLRERTPRLRRVDCTAPGYTRRRSGSGFTYLDHRGRPLRDPAELDRIRALAIPPAWQDVWICPLANGHLQAVGTDAAGRRQYLYHAVWRIRRDREKFEEMIAFARVLPRLREESARLLRRRGLPKERVLGFAVTLLDRGLFRVGSEEYAKQNDSYGLTTLERRHVHLVSGDTVEFAYKGKTGKRLVHTVTDPRLSAVARELLQRPTGGKPFLVFENGDGLVEVRADDINAFIKSVCGGDFSAKDFRTWHATVLAAASLALSDEPRTTAGRNRALRGAAETVSLALGNTPAISKASYIDPRVFDLYRSGSTISRRAARRLLDAGEPDLAERAVVRLLNGRGINGGRRPARRSRGRPSPRRARARAASRSPSPSPAGRLAGKRLSRRVNARPVRRRVRGGIA